MEKDLNGHFSKEDICRANKHTPGKTVKQGTSLMVQWLGLHVSNAGGAGSIPGHQGTKIPHALWCGQKIKINKTKQQQQQQKCSVSIGCSVSVLVP